MNKTELIAAMAETSGLSKKDCDAALAAFITTVETALKSGEKVQLIGFGSFEVKERAARTGRNPRSKETIEIPASQTPVFKAGKALKEAGISARVINMATVKPLDEELVLKAARECGKIITCEEHSILGGLGEAVCGLLSEKCPTPVRRIGVNDEFGHSGPAAALLKQFGLCAEHIVEVAKDFCQ